MTPRQLIEKWTPGIFCDGSELNKVLAIVTTAMLIENGAIEDGPEARAYMQWYRENFSGDRQ